MLSADKLGPSGNFLPQPMIPRTGGKDFKTTIPKAGSNGQDPAPTATPGLVGLV